MKYILILYICTLSQPYCEQDQVINEQFNNYYDCITKGYLHSYNFLTTMYDKEDIIEQKLAIKFACKDMSEPT
jgi:hypothetical protein